MFSHPVTGYQSHATFSAKTSLRKFYACFNREKKKPNDVLPKHTCLAKALQSCETILFLHYILCIWTSDQSHPVLRASVTHQEKLLEGK